MRQRVVSNAGPLIALSKLNALTLLHGLYGEVLLPPAVFRETVTRGLHGGHEDARTLHLYFDEQGWKPTGAVSIPLDIDELKLDSGEKESIALALQWSALLLMDEERGRIEARHGGLTVRGTLGVLKEAYQQRMITLDQLTFYFHQIEVRTDIWISPELCRRVMEEILTRTDKD